MLEQIEYLKTKMHQLEELCNELEKRIFQQERQSTNEWSSALKNSRLDIAEIKSNIDILPNSFKELIEKENFLRENGSVKKLQKFEKKKKRFLDSIDGLLKICEMLEDNLRITISQI